jgi:nucleoid-associated protein YgaU
MLAGKLVAQAQADADGQFVMLPPKLPPGDHVLALRATGASGEIVSEQTVAIAVPARGERETIAALTEPNKPTIVLSQPGGPGGAAGSDLRIVSVEAQQGGAFYASGVAPAGSNLRLYLNESYVASVEAGADGKWSIRIERGMTGGAYRVRADRIGTDGRASARVEAPFDYPAELARQTAAASQMNDGQRRGSPVASSEPAAASSPSVPESAAAASLAKPAATGGAAANQADASQSSAAGLASASPSAATPVAPGASPTPPRLADPQNVVIQEVRTARVVRGDSLWKISHSIYGEGIRYTQIYDANTSQIRDPDLIYPGQVLVVPKQDEQKPRGNERRR